MPQGRIASRPYAPRMTLAQLAENTAREREGREPIRNEPTIRGPMRFSTRVAQGVQNLLTLAFGDQGQDPSDLMSPMLAPIKVGAKAAGRAIRAFHGSPHDVGRLSTQYAGSTGGTSFGRGINASTSKEVASAYRQSGRSGTPEGKGVMYELELALSKDEILDWESPLSTQGGVASKLERLGVGRMPKDGDPFGGGHWVVSDDGMSYGLRTSSGTVFPMSKGDISRLYGSAYGSYGSLTGGQLYNRLALQLGSDKAASEALTQAGVKASQNMEAGVRNYVVFDDKIIDIMKKYGVALPVAAILFQLQERRSKPPEKAR